MQSVAYACEYGGTKMYRNVGNNPAAGGAAGGGGGGGAGTGGGGVGGAFANATCHTAYNPPMNHYMNMIDQAWYNDMLAANYNSIAEQSSSSREQRNKAEKMRRDKLNYYISELAGLVPLISTSPKRMDKTSILRLTATHLRIYQTLVNGNCERMRMPREIDQFVIENLVCEQLGGFLMILAGNGKVIFVSPTVENILGHLQTDLMGQSVFSVIAPEDQSRFKMYLRTDMVPESDWRKYFNLRLRRAGPRSESPVYEAIEVMGVKQVTQSQLSPQSESHSRDLQALNNDLWVFFMRLNRPEPITDQLIEASKDEYVTRHLIDGRIINCDQRISFIAGYMIEEVSGLTAFKFMHRDDVRWVMIALRQMYDKGEARGSSCYRLLSRTGQFIYLRTYGFLEIDSTGTVKSFICVNKLVTEKEGVKLITEMKERYSPLVNSSPPQLQLTNEEEVSGSVEDPVELEEAIATLLSNLPSPDSEASDQTTHASSEVRDCPSTPSVGSMSPCDTSSNASLATSTTTTVAALPPPPPSVGKIVGKRSSSVDSASSPPTAAAQKRIRIEAPVQVASPTEYNHRQQRPFPAYADEHR